jgi:hypothetical protein
MTRPKTFFLGVIFAALITVGNGNAQTLLC